MTHQSSPKYFDDGIRVRAEQIEPGPLPPTPEEAEASLRDEVRRRFIAQHGSLLGEMAYKTFVNERESAIEGERAQRSEADDLARQITAAYEEERVALVPLHAALERASAARDEADRAIASRISATASQVAGLQARRNAILASLNGVPPAPKTLADEPPAPKVAAIEPTLAPTTAIVLAVRRVHIGDRDLEPGETVELPLADAAWLEAIGAVRQVDAAVA